MGGNQKFIYREVSRSFEKYLKVPFLFRSIPLIALRNTLLSSTLFHTDMFLIPFIAFQILFTNFNIMLFHHILKIGCF